LLIAAKKLGYYWEIMLATRSGLRRSELMRCRWEDLDFDRKLIFVPIAKSQKPRVIPMHSDLLALEQLSLGRGYVFPSSWDRDRPYSLRRWNNIAQRLQKYVPGFEWRRCRSHFATSLVRSGVHQLKVQKWLGHANLETTMRYYADVACDNYDEDINRLSEGQAK
ncbi:MAG: site-specific integrase, partial [Deltaproteobacteria bacterium]|nr:site-specific integrase [Deltaproteobacteria bacterium]